MPYLALTIKSAWLISKSSLESPLASSQVLTGKQVIARQKAQELLAEEFAKTAEFEQRNKRPKRPK